MYFGFFYVVPCHTHFYHIGIKKISKAYFWYKAEGKLRHIVQIGPMAEGI